MPFFPLELAVLKEICKQEAEQQRVLEEQLAAAVVTGRKNSGAGFFTYLAVDPTSVAPMKNRNRAVGNVVADIDGFKGPLLLLLFVEDGYAATLEGATVEDDTTDVDFANCAFKIRSM